MLHIWLCLLILAIFVLVTNFQMIRKPRKPYFMVSVGPRNDLSHLFTVFLVFERVVFGLIDIPLKCGRGARGVGLFVRVLFADGGAPTP